MITIWKYDISEVPRDFSMPKDAKVIHVDCINHEIFLWALVDTEAPLERRNITWQGTGWKLDHAKENIIHHGTVKDGNFIWHVIEYLL